MSIDKGLLGKILASVAIAAIDAGTIFTNPEGIATKPEEINEILDGFLAVWLGHPASGQNVGSMGQVSGGKTTP